MSCFGYIDNDSSCKKTEYVSRFGVTTNDKAKAATQPNSVNANKSVSKPVDSFSCNDPSSEWLQNLFMMQLASLAKLQGKSMATGTPITSNNVFDTAINFVLKAEGGYVNNKNDHGGATNMGITQKTYDACYQKYGFVPKDVKKLLPEEAKIIYYNEYWKASGADKLAATDPKMAIALFDTAVLHGVTGAKRLQEQSGGDVSKLIQLREEKCSKLAKNKSQEEFGNGWANRFKNLKDFLGIG